MRIKSSFEMYVSNDNKVTFYNCREFVNELNNVKVNKHFILRLLLHSLSVIIIFSICKGSSGICEATVCGVNNRMFTFSNIGKLFAN